MPTRQPRIHGVTPLRLPSTVPGVALFGGTFDPPHRGHVDLPRRVRDAALGSDWWLVFVPAARSPHKHQGPAAPDRHRIAMLRAATRGMPNSRIWTDEIDRSRSSKKPSYWVDTLRRARRELPRGTPLRFIIGSDQALVFHRWKDFRKILKMAEPLVMVRPPHANRAAVIGALRRLGAWSPAELMQWGGWIDTGERLGLSSTRARKLLAGGRGQAYLRKSLPPAVRGYIAKHRLYS